MKVDKVSLVVPLEPDYIVMPIFKELKRYRKKAKEKYFEKIYEKHNIEIFKPRNKTFKPSIGILSLASILEKKGIETNILHQDYLKHIGKWESALREASESSDVIGFTAMTVSYNEVLKSLRKVKKINPSIFTIVGGPHVTYLPEQALADGFDGVIRGEGEQTLDELIFCLKNNDNLEEIDGLSIKLNNESLIKPARDRIDGSKIPIPAYHLIPEGMLKNMSIQLQTARGCPFSCNFCVENGKMTFRNFDSILEDIDTIIKYAGNTIWIADSLTGIPEKRTKDLAEILHNNFPKLSFFFQTRLGIMSEKMYHHMAKNNFVGIKLGLESFSDNTLNLMGKRQTYDKYLSELRIIKDIFPIREANFMLGYPGEKLQDCHETIERLDQVLKEDLIQTISCSMFTPYPGSQISMNSLENNIILNSKKFENYITKGFPPNYHTKDLSEFEIYSLMLRVIALETDHLYRKSELKSSPGFNPKIIEKYGGKRS